MTFKKDSSFKKFATANHTSQSFRGTPPMITIDHKSIRDDKSTSPKAIQATDRRIDYLLKAKQARNEKKELMSIRKSSETGRAANWAADSSIVNSVHKMSLMPV